MAPMFSVGRPVLVEKHQQRLKGTGKFGRRRPNRERIWEANVSNTLRLQEATWKG